MGKLRLDVMADESFRKDILDLVREQVRPVVVEQLGAAVREAVEKVVNPGRIESALRSVLTDFLSFSYRNDDFVKIIAEKLTEHTTFQKLIADRMQSVSDARLDDRVNLAVKAHLRRIGGV